MCFVSEESVSILSTAYTVLFQNSIHLNFLLRCDFITVTEQCSSASYQHFTWWWSGTLSIIAFCWTSILSSALKVNTVSQHLVSSLPNSVSELHSSQLVTEPVFCQSASFPRGARQRVILEDWSSFRGQAHCTSFPQATTERGTLL